MPIRHTVKAGQCLYSIAAQYGMFPDAIWRDPGNRDLRQRRDRADALAPGDVLVIPDSAARTEAVADSARHRFRRRGVPVKLRLRVLYRNAPRAHVSWTADVDGESASGTTDGEGVLELQVPPGAMLARLRVGPPHESQQFQVHLGRVYPASELAGIRARLENLGFPCGQAAAAGEDSLDEATASAIRLFQEACGHPRPNGEMDETTRRELLARHGA